MKQRGIYLILFAVVLHLWVPLPSHGKDGLPPAPFSPYVGKTYKSFEDPEYRAYDEVIRAVVVKQIQRRFGVVVDPKKYSGFELLELRAFLMCRKSAESFENFLRLFPKNP